MKKYFIKFRKNDATYHDEVYYVCKRVFLFLSVDLYVTKNKIQALDALEGYLKGNYK